MIGEGYPLDQDNHVGALLVAGNLEVPGLKLRPSQQRAFKLFALHEERAGIYEKALGFGDQFFIAGVSAFGVADMFCLRVSLAKTRGRLSKTGARQSGEQNK